VVDQDTKSDGRRWYDPNRMTLALFAVVSFFVIGWGSWVFALARANEAINAQQEIEIRLLKAELGGIKETQGRQSDKMDRINDKIDKVLDEVRKR
jgi:hypothetical protein